jgi:hypothetical protein
VPRGTRSRQCSECLSQRALENLKNLMARHSGKTHYQLTTRSSTLRQSFFHGPAAPTQPQFNYLQVIRKNSKASSLNWKGRHVSGHQDKWKTQNELNWWEQTNVCMDLGAKSKMCRPSFSPSHPISGQEGWSLWLHNKKYTSFDINWIYMLASEERGFPPIGSIGGA